MNAVTNREGGASAPPDLLAPDRAINEALAECVRLRGALEAAKIRIRDVPNEDDLKEPYYLRLGVAEERMARTAPTTLPGLCASAQWFIAYRDHAPSDDELGAWPETIERALLDLLARMS